jgi:hypothetical protein
MPSSVPVVSAQFLKERLDALTIGDLTFGQ